MPQAPNIHYRPTYCASSQIINFIRRLRIPIPFELLTKIRADFHIFPAFIGWPSIFKTPSAAIIHDLAYLDRPDTVSKRNLHDLTEFVPVSISRSCFIVTISDATRQRLEEVYKHTLPPILVEQIPIAPLPSVTPSKRRRELLGWKITHKGYILFVGTLEPRKNITCLIDAYEALPLKLRSRYALVLAGGEGWNNEHLRKKINDAKESGMKIVTTGYVSEAQKAVLYHSAAVFVLPSLYEGFGMPVLEALSCNIPVILSDIQVLREITGSNALYTDPRKPQELSVKITTLLTNKQLYEDLCRAGKSVARNANTWDHVAQTFYDTIKERIKSYRPTSIE